MARTEACTAPLTNFPTPALTGSGSKGRHATRSHALRRWPLSPLSGAPLVLLEKIACSAFPGHQLRCRRQKAWFLPPALARSYARAGVRPTTFNRALLAARRLRASSSGLLVRP